VGGVGEGRHLALDLTKKAKKLRKNATDAERFLWKHLRFKQVGGLKFRRQEPIGNYIVDFVCYEKAVVVEVDGGQHSEAVDSHRDTWLMSQGFTVLRFWNHEVLTKIEGVLEMILRNCSQKSPSPTPPIKGGATNEGQLLK
jgi:very-short-patch-repair endonuclease